MTKATVARELRLLIDGILSAYEIDNLQLSIDLVEGIKKFQEASTSPVKARGDILEGMRRRLSGSVKVFAERVEIAAEIERRLHIKPVGREWEDFIEWARKQGGITQFLDWWLSDQWRLEHPPSNPQRFYVMWPQAFQVSETKTVMNPVKEVEDAIPNPYRKPEILTRDG